MNHEGFTLWLSGADQAALAERLLWEFRARSSSVELLEGDANRIGASADRLAREGVIVLAAPISPNGASPDDVPARPARFIEIFAGFNESALTPEIVVQTDRETVDESLAKILRFLEERGLIEAEALCPTTS